MIGNSAFHPTYVFDEPLCLGGDKGAGGVAVLLAAVWDGVCWG